MEDYLPQQAVRVVALKVVAAASAVVAEGAEAEADLADEAWITHRQ